MRRSQLRRRRASCLRLRLRHRRRNSQKAHRLVRHARSLVGRRTQRRVQRSRLRRRLRLHASQRSLGHGAPPALRLQRLADLRGIDMCRRLCSYLRRISLRAGEGPISFTYELSVPRLGLLGGGQSRLSRALHRRPLLPQVRQLGLHRRQLNSHHRRLRLRLRCRAPVLPRRTPRTPPRDPLGRHRDPLRCQQVIRVEPGLLGLLVRNVVVRMRRGRSRSGLSFPWPAVTVPDRVAALSGRRLFLELSDAATQRRKLSARLCQLVLARVQLRPHLLQLAGRGSEPTIDRIVP
eukprot:scaffold7177_cov114-Isochrysis_galbana.AAC.3